MHLDVHHGKSGYGLGSDFDMQEGPVTLLNPTQFGAGDTFKLIYAIGEIIPGTILNIGNPNARVRIAHPLHEFIDAWCRQAFVLVGSWNRQAHCWAVPVSPRVQSQTVFHESRVIAKRVEPNEGFMKYSMPILAPGCIQHPNSTWAQGSFHYLPSPAEGCRAELPRP